MSNTRFTGTERYVATDDLTLSVNAAVTLGRPLLVKGEPGTGKTQLAEEVALSLGRPLFEWHIKSTTKAQQELYEYDAVSRLRDSQLGDDRVKDIGNYIVRGRVWEAFLSDVQPVLLIDEIDKADIEFPNDLLRCFFHYIRVPDAATMERIVDVHFPSLKRDLLREALQAFYALREVPGLKKKPSTSELLDWIKLLLAEDIPAEALRETDAKKMIPPLYGALLKNEQDVHLFEQLLFMHRRNAR